MTWSEVMTKVMGEEPAETGARLKWKASRNGGRAVATPHATTQSLAATRRAAKPSVPIIDFQTDIHILGEMGREDGHVVGCVMRRVVGATGLRLVECDYTAPPKMGQLQHLATSDPSAPPGRVRAYLSSPDEVRKMFAALQGQTVKVGLDIIGIEVSNDIIDADNAPGGGRRKQ